MARGEFDILSKTMRVGIRQDVSDIAERANCLRNANWRVADCLTKDRGIRQFNALPIGTGTTYGLFEARFSDGTQTLLAFQDTGSACSVHRWQAAAGLFTVPMATTLARVKPYVTMFANKVAVLDGVAVRTINSATAANLSTLPTTDTSLSGQVNDFSFVGACTWGVVYANRLVLFGSPDSPWYFYPSEVREYVWDAAIGYSVMSTRGERILGACTCGPYLLVGGEEFLRAFYLGTAGPEDWDWDSLSEEVGPINWQSMVQVTRGYGNDASAFTFFWGKHGPMMVAYMGSGLPTLVPLWRQLQIMLMGVTQDDLPGLDLTTFDQIEAVYAPEYDEVRFACRYAGSTANDVLLCVDVNSCVAMMVGSAGAYPLWRVRDNAALTVQGSAARGLPCGTVATAEMHPTSGALTTTGVRRVLLGDSGFVYEMDADDACLDLVSELIPMTITLGGITGADQDMRDFEKVVRKASIHCTRTGAYTFKVIVTGDGEDAKTGVIPDGGVYHWADSQWGSGLWSDYSWSSGVADIGCRGHVFEVTIRDEGTIKTPVSLSSWNLYGYLEGRR
jgi:hypothetical protein